MLTDLRNEIKKYATSERAKAHLWFFKTGKGEYGEGDEFVGITVPQCRIIAKQFNDLSLSDLQKLLHSKIHEERLIALLILVHRFEKGSDQQKEEIYTFYLQNTKFINNWDLVDSSADKIVGKYLYQLSQRHSGKRGTSASRRVCDSGVMTRISNVDPQVKKRSWTRFRSNYAGQASQDDEMKILENLACSDNLWERRIAVISTFAFIKHGESSVTLQIAEMLVNDKHDLIQKAVGWMLREVGKRVSQKDEVEFLKKHYKTMPRTMLRYAIEHFPPEVRKQYLQGVI